MCISKKLLQLHKHHSQLRHTYKLTRLPAHPSMYFIYFDFLQRLFPLYSSRIYSPLVSSYFFFLFLLSYSFFYVTNPIWFFDIRVMATKNKRSLACGCYNVNRENKTEANKHSMKIFTFMFKEQTLISWVFSMFILIEGWRVFNAELLFDWNRPKLI